MLELHFVSRWQFLISLLDGFNGFISKRGKSGSRDSVVEHGRSAIITGITNAGH